MRKAKNPGSDWPWSELGSKIETLVRATYNYIVYVDEKKALQWDTAGNYYLELRTHKDFNLTQYNSILGEASVLEAGVRPEFDDAARTELLCLIGNAIVCDLETDYVAAKSALAYAKDYLSQRSEEISRRWYLFSSFVAAGCFIGIGLFVWVLSSFFQRLIGLTIMWMIFAGSAGAAGALLSVILRSGKLSFDPSAGRLLHYLEGSSRICAGAISGSIVLLALKSGLILQSNGLATSNQFIILGATAAGASERLAASIISKIENNAQTQAAIKKTKPN